MEKITVEEYIAWLIKQIGTKEKPAGSNNVIYNTHYYGKEVRGSAYPWCVVIHWDGFRELGASELFYDGKKTASCTTLMNWAKSKKQWYSKGIRGDIGVCQFKTGRHMVCIEKVNKDGTYNTIEGNTSVDSDDNGGCVMRRVRKQSQFLGFFRPKYSNPSVKYQAHVQTYGWQNEVKDGATAGTTGQAKRMEAIKIWSDGIDFTYQVHCQTYGWMDKVSNGKVAGTEGKGKRMEAIKIWSDKPIKYRVHVQGIGWQDWKTNGQEAGTTGQAKRLEAIEIKFA